MKRALALSFWPRNEHARAEQQENGACDKADHPLEADGEHCKMPSARMPRRHPGKHVQMPSDKAKRGVLNLLRDSSRRSKLRIVANLFQVQALPNKPGLVQPAGLPHGQKTEIFDHLQIP